MSKTNSNTNGTGPQIIVRPNGDTVIWHNEPVVPLLPTDAEARRQVAVLDITSRAVYGDLRDADIEAVLGLLLIAGATWAGCQIWRDVIITKRAALLPGWAKRPGAMVEMW